MVLYLAHTQEGLLENWSSANIYLGGSMPETTSIRIVDDIYDFKSIGASWDDMVRTSTEAGHMQAGALIDRWKEFAADRGRSLHILFVYSSGKLLGGAPFIVRYRTSAGQTVHRSLELMSCSAGDGGPHSCLDRSAGRSCIAASRGNESIVAAALAAYLTDTMDYWGEVQMDNASADSFSMLNLVPLLTQKNCRIRLEWRRPEEEPAERDGELKERLRHVSGLIEYSLAAAPRIYVKLSRLLQEIIPSIPRLGRSTVLPLTRIVKRRSGPGGLVAGVWDGFRNYDHRELNAADGNRYMHLTAIADAARSISFRGSNFLGARKDISTTQTGVDGRYYEPESRTAFTCNITILPKTNGMTANHLLVRVLKYFRKVFESPHSASQPVRGGAIQSSLIQASRKPSINRKRSASDSGVLAQLESFRQQRLFGNAGSGERLKMYTMK